MPNSSPSDPLSSEDGGALTSQREERKATRVAERQQARRDARKAGLDPDEAAAVVAEAELQELQATQEPAPAEPAPQATTAVQETDFPPPVSATRPRRRHWIVVFTFLLCVVSPAALAGWYLYARATDQFASTVGFSVRTEEAGSAIELLGGITELSGSSSSDTDILYEFLQSQELVTALDARLDLRSIWSRTDPEMDPFFVYHAPGTIEDLVDHWGRMIRIYYDSGTGLIELRVLAFDPNDAQAIAQAIFDESSAMINELSAIAREDAIGYARDELEEARIRLTEARVTLAEWRNVNQTVDPTADTAGQMGLVTSLQAQLADALIELDLLRETTRENDPRVSQAERLIAVIEGRIAAEREVLGTTGTGQAFADLVGEYERLIVDLEFAQESYTAALGAFYAASSEAQRQSRYLAAHIRPTLAERADYPDRPMLLGLIALFLFLGWCILVLVAYSLKDRR